MILDYEKALVEYVAKMDPSITAIQFSNDFHIIHNVQESTKYPVAIIQRNLDKMTMNTKSWEFETDEGVTRFYPCIVQYRLRVWMSRESQAISYLHKTRFYFKKNPYLNLNLDNEVVPIGMRFIYSGMEVEQDGDSKKGPQRSADAVWESTLPLDDSEKMDMIDSVAININGNVITII